MSHLNVVDLTTDSHENVKIQAKALPISKIIETVPPISTQQIQSYPVISFSLINTQEFTAKADQTVNKEIISVLKMVPGVNFDWNLKRWIFPLNTHDMLQVALASCRVAVEPLPRKTMAIAQLQNRKNKELESISSHSEDTLRRSIHERLLNALAPFQRNGVLFVLQNNGRAMIADEMGLGKTIQAIAATSLYPTSWPVLVIVPSSAKYHWKSELTSWMCPEVLSPEDICVIETGATLVLPRHKFIIMSYHLLQKIDTLLKNIPFNMIIADESHYLKNGKAMRTRLLLPLLQSVERVILLTGTPALSRPMELFVQLNALAPLCWSNELEFAKRYCNGKKRKSNGANAAYPSENASNTGELHAMLSGTIMIRRLKKEILSQLPLKRRVAIKISVNDKKKATRLKGMLEMIHKNKIGLRRTRKRKIIENTSEVNSSRDRNDNSQSHTITTTNSNGYDIGSKEDNIGNTTIPTNNILPNQNPGDSVGSGCGGGGMGGEGEDPSTSSKNILLELFKESGEAKLPAVLNQLDHFLNDRMTGKILVFAHHRVVLDGIESFLKNRRNYPESSSNHQNNNNNQSQNNNNNNNNNNNYNNNNNNTGTYIRIDGNVAQAERYSRVNTFQNIPECRVAVLAITAAGIAITLTAAATVYFAEMFWTPGSLLQAEDRAHRIGQTSSVKVHYFLGIDTIDNILWPLLQAKMKVLGEIVEGQSDIELVSATATDADTDSDTRIVNNTNTNTNDDNKVIESQNEIPTLTTATADELDVLPDNLEDLIEEMSRDAMISAVPVEAAEAVVDSDSDEDGDLDSPDPLSSSKTRNSKSSGSRLSKELLLQPSNELYTTNGMMTPTASNTSSPLLEDDNVASSSASKAMEEDMDMLASLYVEEQRLLELQKVSQQSIQLLNTNNSIQRKILNIKNENLSQNPIKSFSIPVMAARGNVPGSISPKVEIIDLEFDDDNDDNEKSPKSSIQSNFVQNNFTTSSSCNSDNYSCTSNSSNNNSNNYCNIGGNSIFTNITGANYLENLGRDYSLNLANNNNSNNVTAMTNTAASYSSVIGGVEDDDDVVFIPSWRKSEQVI